MDKIKVFEQEINYIKDEVIKKDAEYLVSILPDYFFEIAASSTGKYHPKYSLGDGGLVRHTKSAVRFAYELLSNPSIGNKYTKEEQDIMILGIIVHDGLKLGKNKAKYTIVDHPLAIAEYIMENKTSLKMKEELLTLLCAVVKTHMGPWNKDFNGNEVLPVPKTKYENFVHMCDYLSSKKCFLVEFDQDNNIIS